MPRAIEKLNIENWSIDRPKPYGRNPRKISPEAIAKVAASIKSFGFRQPIVVDRKGVIVVGHARLLAARELGLAHVPVHVAGDLSKRDARAYRLADNRSGEEAVWDVDLLKLELKDLGNDAGELTGFDSDEMKEYSGAATIDETPAPVDEAAKLRKKWRTSPGQTWEIGKHLLICGDNRTPAVAAPLLKGKPVLMATDPPYGISIVRVDGQLGGLGGASPFRGKTGRAHGTGNRIGGRMNGAGGAVPANVYAPIVGDDEPFDPRQYLTWAKTVVLFGANCFAPLLPVSRGWIVWDKVAGLEGTSQSYSDGELAWSNQDAPLRIYRQVWHGMVRQGEHDKRTHPTQKPIGLFAWLIELFTKAGDLVIDPFAGSGPQFLAAEKLGRVCYGAEIDPAYVAVTLERLSMIGLKPKLIKS